MAREDSRAAPQGLALEMLEPYCGKLSCMVLRGLGVGNLPPATRSFLNFAQIGVIDMYKIWFRLNVSILVFSVIFCMLSSKVFALEMLEERIGRVSIGDEGLLVDLVRDVKTKKITGSDAWGNIYGVPDNTGSCGNIIDPTKETKDDVEMIEKRVGQISVGEDGILVELMRNVQTGKLSGSDAWGNIYGVPDNTDHSGKVIDISKETEANVVMIASREGIINRDGKQVTLMRNKQTGKLEGCDNWGNAYGVVGNTRSNGRVIDKSKEIEANVVRLDSK